MRLHWFSPLPPARTDIANFTARLVPLLAAKAELVLWTDHRRARIDEPGVSVRFWRRAEAVERRIPADEHAVYNVGNDWRYHARIAALSRRRPGIVIQHELDLCELAVHMQRHGFLDEAELLDALRATGGAAAVQLGRACLARTEPLDRLAHACPLTGWGLDRARGAVVHVPEAAAALSRAAAGPVLAAELPYLPRARLHPPRAREPGVLRRRRARIGVFGLRLGKSRRLLPLLTALATHENRESFELTIVGRIAGRREIRAAIRRLGLTRNVRLSGFLAEPALERLLAQVDLAANLRHPTRGEASGGLLRLWNHSLPCLVTDVDWYARLPVDCVAHVHPERELADIGAHLTRFLEDPEHYFAMGTRARARLEECHTAERYVDRLTSWLAGDPADPGPSTAAV